MPKPESPARTWGLRFSAIDGVVILATILGTVALWNDSSFVALLLPIVLGHFFLFCNVFRIDRRLELLWAAIFVVNTFSWSIAFDALSWLGILIVQTPLTMVLIAAELRSPRYHGIFARRINSELERYLDGTL